MIETLTPRRTAEILRDCGMKTSEETIRLGLQQGVFPFGECILQENGRKVCYVYKRLLDKWIAERNIPGTKIATGTIALDEFYPENPTYI